MMYDFATNPSMSLRSRIKRKYAKPEEFHFYGVGQYETSKVYNAVVKAIQLTRTGFRSTVKIYYLLTDENTLGVEDMVGIEVEILLEAKN
ncbi:hypothetical protein OESDEN_17319 [Oesophagostomum dentatum]|uniref:Uncharacterized protein n=1 Tax=Oesophagostomum dentatum TaxID=61180 RepID=A0A0B1SGG5_OESDE|nr:hypothetical protein OESDEN_17319 [Oesophagostomum dentatum]